MLDARKGMSSSPAPATPAGKKAGASGTPKIKNEEEATIKVASKKDKDSKDKDSKDAKDSKDGGGGSKTSGVIKLKKPPPKHKQPGNWKEGTFVDRKWTNGDKSADTGILLMYCC
jgi:hypothetical protein